jgi:uncharacterized integral membrane protein
MEFGISDLGQVVGGIVLMLAASTGRRRDVRRY